MAAKNDPATEKISKNEAVRRALAALGQDADLTDLQTHIKDNFGLEMSTNHIAASRSEAVRKQGSKAKPAKAKPTARKEGAPPSPQPAGDPAATGTISKQEAVRRALKELGPDAKPLVIQGFVKQTFGIDMGTDHISTAKGQILREPKKKGARKAGTRKQVAGPTAPAAAAASPAMAGRIVIEDVLLVKALADRVGPDQLLTLIGAFAK
jgi:hypothetical protein